MLNGVKHLSGAAAIRAAQTMSFFPMIRMTSTSSCNSVRGNCRRATRPRIRRVGAPQGVTPKHATLAAGDRLGACGRVAHIFVGLVKDGAADAVLPGPRDSVVQMHHRRDAQHHQVARLSRLCEAPPGLKACVADLHDLVGERDVSPHQYINIVKVDLRFRHGRAPRPWPAHAAPPAHHTPGRETTRRQNRPAGSCTQRAARPGGG